MYENKVRKDSEHNNIFPKQTEKQIYNADHSRRENTHKNTTKPWWAVSALTLKISQKAVKPSQTRKAPSYVNPRYDKRECRETQ